MHALHTTNNTREIIIIVIIITAYELHLGKMGLSKSSFTESFPILVAVKKRIHFTHQKVRIEQNVAFKYLYTQSYSVLLKI